MIAEHHISLHETIKGYSGIINHKLSPKKIIHSCAKIVKELCEMNYGSSPDIKILGDTETQFPYIDVHVEYMMTELLKNSFRATVEHSRKIGRFDDPAIVVHIGEGTDDVSIRIRDLGGGLDQKLGENVWQYSITTIDKDHNSHHGVLSHASQLAVEVGTGGPMAGLGYGLPMTRIYAGWAGGSLDLVSLDGYGCDTFLRLPHIGQVETLKI